jgi:hypothetical protein
MVYVNNGLYEILGHSLYLRCATPQSPPALTVILLHTTRQQIVCAANVTAGF